MKLWIRIATPFTIVMGIAASAQAQSYGYGMWGGMQSCPYQVSAGAGASSEQDAIKEIQQSITELQKQKRSKDTELKRLQTRDMRDSKKAIEGVISADYADFIFNHIDTGRSCTEYKGIGQEGDTIAQGDEGGTAVQAPGTEETSPFESSEWNQMCDKSKVGSVSGSVCSVKKFRAEDKGAYTVEDCRRALVDYRKQKLQQDKLKREVAALDRQIAAQKDALKDARQDAIDAQRQAQQDRLEGGICETCAMTGNGYTYQKPETDWASVAGNLVLGGLATYAGYKTNQMVVDANSSLGYPSNPYPAWGFGFPFFAQGLSQAIGGGSGIYGAIGGGVGAGGFGCAGNNGGPYGMQGPFGGAMGNGMWGNPYMMAGMNPSMMGGLFLPGMGPWGAAGPWGIGGPYAGAMGYPMMGGMMGMPMGNMIGGVAGGIMGMPMGSMAGGYMMGMPMGAMAGGYMMGMPMGSMVGGVAGGIMGMPMGSMMAGGMMGMPMGSMAGGLMGMPMGAMMGMPMGSMLGGVAGGMMGMPMGSMMDGSMMGMGGMAGSLGMMQMQQQMMQMQMQQYQSYMQQQQTYMQQQMQRQQVVASLQTELYGLISRIQQVQYGYGTTGYIGGSIGIGGTIGTGYMSSSYPIGGLTSPGYGGVGGGVTATTPIGSAVPSIPTPVGGATATTPIGTGR